MGSTSPDVPARAPWLQGVHALATGAELARCPNLFPGLAHTAASAALSGGQETLTPCPLPGVTVPWLEANVAPAEPVTVLNKIFLLAAFGTYKHLGGC